MTNIIKDKSFEIAIDIIKLNKHLNDEKKEFIISKQIVRSGTSIGANIAESEFAVSTRDFLNKLCISLKECSETIYWLDLLHKTDYISKGEYELLSSKCIEVRRMLISSTKTLKEKLGDK